MASEISLSSIGERSVWPLARVILRSTWDYLFPPLHMGNRFRQLGSRLTYPIEDMNIMPSLHRSSALRILYNQRWAVRQSVTDGLPFRWRADDWPKHWNSQKHWWNKRQRKRFSAITRIVTKQEQDDTIQTFLCGRAASAALFYS